MGGYYISLRAKVFYLFAAMASITLACFILILWYTHQIDNMLINMVQKEVVLYKTAHDMELALANQKGFLTYYFVDGNARWLNNLGQYREMFRQTLKSAFSFDLNEKQRQSLQNIADEYKAYVAAKDHTIENYNESMIKENISAMHEQQRSVFFNLLELCRQFRENQWKVIIDTEQVNKQRSEYLRFIAYSALISFAILCLLIFYILYKQILEPIRGLAIETGGSPMESSKDEILSLSHSLKGMMKDFNETHNQLTKSRESLIQAEKMAMVGELAAGVAHSIRNPFTSIKMRMFSLSRSTDLTDVQNEDLEVITDEIGRIDRILQNFLEFARPPKLAIDACHVTTIIESTITLLEYRLKEYSVKITHNPKNDLPEVRVDRDRIKEALVNLITNACEAMENGGRIFISETLVPDSAKGEVVRITLKDNGPGIPDRIIQKITDPFFTTKENGSGLGLSIVSRIVREHNGLFYASPFLEDGAEFIIELPVNQSGG